ncbi:MAG: DNA topoisomerase I [Nanoarchaeota archaeon]|nr:DNA topoisomerase I [Nanoarchaeota archaeon]
MVSKLARIRAEEENAALEEPIPVLAPKKTTEVQVKEIPTEQIEKQGTKKPVKRKVRKTRKRKSNKDLPLSKRKLKKGQELIKIGNKNVILEIPKVKPIKTGGHTLIITEKPAAAAKIAEALGKFHKYMDDGVPYYEGTRGSKKIIIGCAVGHLFTLNQKLGQVGFPIFELEWIPSYLKKAEFSRKYYFTMLRLVKDANELIVATDHDVEGEVIGYNVVKYIAEKDDAKRMHFSSLTKDELIKSYDHAKKTLDWNFAIAGDARHHLDWLYGINLSRALMAAITTTGKFRIMSIGRVQGPALALIVDRELEIQKFKPEPFWEVYVKVDGIELKHPKDITKETELKKFEKLKGQLGNAKTTKSQQALPPPHPFDLTTLQTESYRFLGLNPSRTLQITQKLYLAGLVSYPRTSSQKIPDAIEPLNILKKLSENYPKEVSLATKKKPIEGKKSDPAHPSIYPTGETKKISGQDEKVYDLIVRRFISCFCEPALIDRKRIEFITKKDKLNFTASGAEVKKKAWLDVYKTKLKETQLKDLEGEHKIQDSKIEKKETQPPRRYSQASLVSELSKRNLGTKATRANIIETLFNRNYVTGQSIEATEIGIKLISTLRKYSPIIVNEELTREFEKDLEEIESKTSKKEMHSKAEKILQGAKKSIITISDDMKKHASKIGKELIEASDEVIEQMKKDNELGFKCPVCKKGTLTIKYTKKSQRFFVACNAWPACENTYPLPKTGKIVQTDKICEGCGFPKLMRLASGKKPWIFCFNMDCPERKKLEAEWAKKDKKNGNKKWKKKEK